MCSGVRQACGPLLRIGLSFRCFPLATGSPALLASNLAAPARNLAATAARGGCRASDRLVLQLVLLRKHAQLFDERLGELWSFQLLSEPCLCQVGVLHLKQKAF